MRLLIFVLSALGSSAVGGVQVEGAVQPLLLNVDAVELSTEDLNADTQALADLLSDINSGFGEKVGLIPKPIEGVHLEVSETGEILVTVTVPFLWADSPTITVYRPLPGTDSYPASVAYPSSVVSVLWEGAPGAHATTIRPQLSGVRVMTIDELGKYLFLVAVYDGYTGVYRLSYFYRDIRRNLSAGDVE